MCEKSASDTAGVLSDLQAGAAAAAAAAGQEGEVVAPRSFALLRTQVLPFGGGAPPDPRSAGPHSGGGREAARQAAERDRLPEGGQTPAGGESPGAEPTQHREESPRPEPAARRGPDQVARPNTCRRDSK